MPPSPIAMKRHGALRILNLEHDETVHQRCLLLVGECASTNTDEDFISIQTRGENGSQLFPEQTWPTSDGNFKALVMLSPGRNLLEITHTVNSSTSFSMSVGVDYVPLLQNPPLHLAIMVAKDSPLMIDCPPHKGGGMSSAHSDLDAAIAKLRMTAYMWQAMTAEDLRSKDLGRRTFRLDEEWTADTVSRDFLNARLIDRLDCEGAMRSTARVHVVRSEKTVKELRDANVAQQNPSAQKDGALFDYFQQALQQAGGPFVAGACPVVAGLILDSHYDVSQKLIVGHAALGCHKPEGLSLGMFGSHLSHSYPRFIEEITSCLTDIRQPGDTMGNDNGDCGSMWESLAIGQGAHLHEVGHSFGAPHRDHGIMECGYRQDWPKNFLAKTAYCRALRTEGLTVDSNTPNDARWHITDALSFRVLPHFRLPSDPVLSSEDRTSKPKIAVDFADDAQGQDQDPILRITAAIGIARVTFNDETEDKPTPVTPARALQYTESELLGRFDQSKPLQLSVLGFNGKETKVANAWHFFTNKTFIRIPGSSIRLTKRMVSSNSVMEDLENNTYQWAQLLRKRGSNGVVHRATSIDLRVGCSWDGGVVRYEDGTVSHWGPMCHRSREPFSFGGHASEVIDLPEGVAITRIEVHSQDTDYMEGVRMYLADGTARGELNSYDDKSTDIHVLEPGPNETIVGFFGTSSKVGFTGVLDFGIITVSKDVGLDGLPDVVYDMPELKNTAGLGDGKNKKRKRSHYSGSDSDDTMDDDDEDS